MTAPDERAFCADIARPNFRLAQLDGRWRLERLAWPQAMIGVAARGGEEFMLRFECTGYPQSPPTATLWDLQRGTILASQCWPKSKGGRVGAVFKSDWKGGSALYLPCDRLAIEGHEHWKAEMPSKIWRPAEGIIQYLELVHELLQCSDYLAPGCAAA